MKDVRPRLKKLLENFPAPKWDPNRTFWNYPRGNAPDIPFCHYTPKNVIYYNGVKFEVLKFAFARSGEIDCILRFTVDGVMYHLATCPQPGGELLYEFFFCKCEDLPEEIELRYEVEKPKKLFDVSVSGKITVCYEYRSDHQQHLETSDPEVVEFLQSMLDLCKDFYLANRVDLDSML